MNTKEKDTKVKNKESCDLSFGSLEFDEVLEGLLQIKPIENEDLKKDVPKKKKSKPKTKK